MPVFKDSTGVEWDVEVNGGTVRRARSLLQIDLGKPREGDNPWLVRFEQDIEFKVNLLYVVCMPQIRQRELNDDQFAERLSGDALRDASLAFYASLLDFFQSLGQTDDAIAIQVMIASLPEVYGVAARNASRIVVDILGTLYVRWQQQQDVNQNLELFANSM
jgi:hypothetical protein